MSITVITATLLPERTIRLGEAMASVACQTLKPEEHLIGVDYVRRGGARVYNLLAAGATTTWLATLPDDDLMYPHHLERLEAETANADVVYSYCDLTGADPWGAYNQPFDPDLLRQLSIVSHVALIRTELVLDLGGWEETKGYDWRFWVKALDAGARFVSVPEKTWRYRLDGGQWHESRPWLAS